MCKKYIYITTFLSILSSFGSVYGAKLNYPIPSNTACSIEVFDVTNVFCSNGDITTLTFDLEYTDPGASGKFVVSDGFGNTSTHNYTNLPVTIIVGAPIDEQFISFTVCDFDNTNCCDTYSGTNPCFQPCGIDFYSIDPICVNGEVKVIIDFFYGSNSSPSFLVTDHFGNTSTYNYADLPIIFTMNGSVQGLTNLNFTVCDAINTGCCNSAEIENPCPWCDFGELNVNTTCQSIANWFDAVIDFDYEVNLSSTFSLKINGVFQGLFQYANLPITISNLEGDCTTTRIFEVEDIATGGCVSEFELAPVCCTPCEISNVTLQNIICNNNNTVLALLDMDYQGNGNGNFTVTDNFGIVNTYAYANLPLMLELNGQSDIPQIGINICDQEFTNCCAFMEFTNPCYNDQPPCNISIFDVQNISCSTGNIANVTFDIALVGEGDNGFVVTDSYGNTSTHSYDDLPLTLAISTQTNDQSINFTVCDIDDPNCCSTIEFTNPCFIPIPCNIAVSDVQNIICSDGDIASLVIDLTYNGVGANGFTLTDDYGNTSTQSYANLPLLITVTAPVDDSIVGFQVCDVDFPNCCTYYQFANPCYDSIPNCYVGIVDGYAECTDEFNFNYHFDLNTQAVSDSFFVTINDSLYGIFSYDNLPVTLFGLVGDCETTYDILVQDQTNPACMNTTTIAPVCCAEPPCSIEVSSIQNVICVGQDTMLFILDLSYENTDSIGFTLYDYVGNLTTYTYDQLPVVISMGAASNVDSVSFVICDIGNGECCTTYNMANPCYITPPCNIEIFDLQNIFCSNGDIATVTFDLAYSGQGNSGFVVTDDYGNVSTHDYTDLPLTIEVTAPTDDELVGFQVCDIDNPNCCDYIEFSNPCFVPPSSNRVIRADINIEQILNAFNVHFDVEHTLEPNCTFTILVNDEAKASMVSSDTFALVGPINCTSADSFKLEILSNCLHDVVWEKMLHKSDIECLTGYEQNEVNPSLINYNIIDNTLSLQCNSLRHCSVGLYDIHGRQVMKQHLILAEERLSLSGLPLGLYIVVLRDEETRISTAQKIVIVRE